MRAGEATVAVPILVSANGKQFTREDAAFTFSYYTHQLPALVALPPVGPVRGDTRVRLAGAGAPGGRDPTCRFALSDGPVHLRATRVDASHTLACISPRATRGVVNISVSLNGQQFDDATEFEYSEPPSVVRALPDMAPSVGGITIEVLSTGLTTELGRDLDRRCRFEWQETIPATVSASLESDGGAHLCRSPAGVLGNVNVEVSINAQQYSEGGAKILVFSNEELE